MANSRVIKGRMKAIGNIQRITKTMQMIATARFQAAQRRATESKPFAIKISEMVSELAASTPGSPSAASAAGATDQQVIHPLLKTSSGTGRKLVLVITSNRGLCGGYNGQILHKLKRWAKENQQTGVDIQMVGKKGVGYCKFNNITLNKILTEFGDKPAYDDVQKLAQTYMQAFIDGTYDSVHVLYVGFESIARQKAMLDTLLPLQNPNANQNEDNAIASKSAVATDYEYSPDPAQLLTQLLPVTVKTKLMQCFNEAVVSEHIARMVAMKNATDAAGKMGKSLARTFNRARQAAITTELTEIIGGAAALA